MIFSTRKMSCSWINPSTTLNIKYGWCFLTSTLENNLLLTFATQICLNLQGGNYLADCIKLRCVSLLVVTYVRWEPTLNGHYSTLPQIRVGSDHTIKADIPHFTVLPNAVHFIAPKCLCAQKRLNLKSAFLY